MRSTITATAAITGFLLTVFHFNAIAAGLELEWRQLAPIPDPLGLGGAYGGTSGKVLIVAGGSNFPGQMPWENGVKAWYQRAYVLESPDAQWKTGFEIPLRAGYGVSASVRDGLVLAGGSNGESHLTNVFLLKWKKNTLSTRDLPPLPFPLAYSCGAALDDSVYVAGGTMSPTATSAEKKFLRLDMRHLERGWTELPSWPGAPRILATAAALDGSLFVVGGAALSPDAEGRPQRTYLKDGYRFTPGRGWHRIADMPNPIVAAPTPAPAAGRNRFLIIGGDDGSLVTFEPLSKHPGFPKRVLCYDTIADAWTELPEAPVSRATLPTAAWRGMQVLISGEAHPGVRSPQVWGFRARSGGGTRPPSSSSSTE